MRKQPHQQRAKVLVDFMLQATEQCIVEEGLIRLTTPKVAERSGISVGSIYQYFENKDELVEELLRRKMIDFGQQFKQLIMHLDDQPLENIIALAVNFGFQSMKMNNGFYLEILKHWHLFRGSEAETILQKDCFDLAMYLFNRFFPTWDIEQLSHKAFVIINSTLFTMVRFASDEYFLIKEQRLQEELSQMIVCYLRNNQN